MANYPMCLGLIFIKMTKEKSVLNFVSLFFFFSTQYEVKKNWLLYHLKLLLQVQINRKKQIKDKKQGTRLNMTQWRTSFEEKPRPNFDHNDQTKQPKKF